MQPPFFSNCSTHFSQSDLPGVVVVVGVLRVVVSTVVVPTVVVLMVVVIAHN